MGNNSKEGSKPQGQGKVTRSSAQDRQTDTSEENSTSAKLKNVLKRLNLNKTNVNVDNRENMFDILLDVVITMLDERDSRGSREGGGDDGEGAGVAEVGEGTGAEETQKDRSAWKEVESQNSKKMRETMDQIKTRVKQNEDYCDHIHQRTLKGNILVFSPQDTSKGLKTILKTPEECEKSGITFTEHVLDHVEQHYGVRIPLQDIVAVHPNRNPGSAIIRIWNRKQGSAYQSLCTAIKKGGKTSEKQRRSGEGEGTDSDQAGEGNQEGEGAQRGDKSTRGRRVNFWLTFQLTRQRNELISALKTLKKEKRIQNFTSNENGEIFLRYLGTGERMKLTYDWKNEDSRTWTVKELKDKFQDK